MGAGDAAVGVGAAVGVAGAAEAAASAGSPVVAVAAVAKGSAVAGSSVVKISSCSLIKPNFSEIGKRAMASLLLWPRELFLQFKKGERMLRMVFQVKSVCLRMPSPPLTVRGLFMFWV